MELHIEKRLSACRLFDGAAFRGTMRARARARCNPRRLLPMRRLAVPILILCLLAAACSNAPSEGRIRSQVVSRLTAHGADQLYDIEGFRQVSGHPQDDGTYVASVHYEIVLKQGISRLPKELEADPKLIRTMLVVGRAMARAAIAGTPIKVGSHIPVDDEVTLVNQDGSWVLE
jgi:hypothetical protein